MTDPRKKPFRCKYIFGTRYVKRVPKAAAPPPIVRINLDAMPTGMSFKTMDRIIKGRALYCKHPK